MKKKLQNIISNSISIFVFAIILIIWQIISNLKIIPGYLLPSPNSIIRALVRERELILFHAKITLFEAFLGLAFGIAFGFIIAVMVDSFEIFKKIIMPFLVVSQTIPTVAIAPLLVLWFGYGIAPKVILIVLVTFFPIAIGLIEGFSSTEKDMLTLMKSMGANKIQTFIHVKFPGALSDFFSGIKIAVAYSVVGAVIAEWLGGFSGLGVYMTRVKKSYSFDKMFAVILVISMISLLLMIIVRIIQKKIMPWEYK